MGQPVHRRIAGGGHAFKINKIFDKSSYLKADIFPPASLSRYGEYPDGSGEYWGLPANQDAYGLMYRKDLFEDPKEKEAFKAKYGKDLAPPQTYQDAKEIAEFFTRPDQGLYGWGQMGGREYDFATTASNQLPVVVRRRALQSRDHRGEGLPQFAGFGRWRPGLCRHVQVRPSRFRQLGLGRGQRRVPAGPARDGDAVVLLQRLELRSEGEQVRRQDRFRILPGAVGRDGKFRRQFSVGGQGMGINTYSKKIEPELAKFMEWYFQPEQQKRYAAVCQTGLKSVLESPDWQGLNSYNRQFPTALQYTTTIGICRSMRCCSTSCSRRSRNAISGAKTVQQALADAASRHERTLQRAGYEIKRGEKTPEVPDQDDHAGPARTRSFR